MCEDSASKEKSGSVAMSNNPKYREAEERFLATFEQAAVGIAHVSPDGSWLRVNRRLTEIVGYSHDQLMTKTFQDITHPDDLDKDMAFVGQMLRGEIDHYSMEKRYFHQNGSIVWINLTVSLVWKSAATPDYFISVVEDISQRKAAEEQIKILNKSLVDIQEKERQFLAMELHDEIGQRLSALKIALSLAAKQSQGNPLALINQAYLVSEGLISSTKDLAHRLRPSQLDDFGLLAAVTSLSQEIHARLSLDIFIEQNINSARFHPDIELACFRIIQESVSNSLRHANCQQIDISLLFISDGILRVSVEDDGNGFLPSCDPNPNSLALGISGMQKRAELAGGELEVNSQPGRGTIISADFHVMKAATCKP